MDRFRYIKIHTWIRGLGSHKVIYFVVLPQASEPSRHKSHRIQSLCTAPPPPPISLYPREKIVKVEGTAVHRLRNQGFIALSSAKAPRWVSQ